RDSEVLRNSRYLEMPHQNALLPQAGGQFSSIMLWVAGEYKVRFRWKHLETNRLQLFRKPSPCFSNFARDFGEIFLIVDSRRCRRDRQSIERVRIKAVFNSQEPFCDFPGRHAVAYSHACQ